MKYLKKGIKGLKWLETYIPNERSGPPCEE